MTAMTRTLLFLIPIFLGGCINQVYPESISSKDDSTRIVFFGDSITEIGVQPQGYVTLVANSLKEEYPNRSIEVIGKGIGGDKVPNLQARLEQDVIEQNPTHVVIYIGINDVWHFYQFEGATGTEPKVFEAGLRDIIAQIHQGGSEVLLCTPSVIGEDPASNSPENQLLMEYAEISRNIASTSEAHLCDLRSAFEQYLQTHNPDKAYQGILTGDGVHLSDRGNRFVADLMLDYLRPFLNK